MRRAGLLAFLVVVLAGTLAVALVGATEHRTLAFTLGVSPARALPEMTPGRTLCQQPIAVAGAFDAVQLQPGTFARPGSALTVVVRSMTSGRQLGRGTLPGGYPDVKTETIPVGSIPRGDDVAVCVTNAGQRSVTVYGDGDGAARGSTALLNGRPTGTDAMLVFRRTSRSTLATIPDLMRHMSLFHGGWIGAWLDWLLLVAVVVAVPLLLGRALVTALRDDAEDETDTPAA